MKYYFLFFLMLGFAFSCSTDDAEFENVRSTSERWVQDVILPRYKGPIKYNTLSNQTLKEALRTDCYIKQKFNGTLEPQYISRYNSRILDVWEDYYIIGNEIKNNTQANDVLVSDLLRLAYVRDQNIYQCICSDKALKRIPESNPVLFYIYRVFVHLGKSNDSKTGFDELIIDVVLDENLNILNSETDLPQSTEKILVHLLEKEE